MDKARRKDLLAGYKQRPPDAGVYRIVNQSTGRSLLGSTMNLESIGNKLKFARATGTPGALDYRLKADAQEVGLEAFEVEVLERLEVTPEMTPTEVREDLAALEALWRERLDPRTLY